MDYRKNLERLIDNEDGFILTSVVEKEGIPREYLSIFMKEKKLERIAHGMYVTPETFVDEMYRIQARNQRIIFSHVTALYLHDLTDRDLMEWSVTVPSGYNATHLRKEGIKVYTVKKELYSLGAEDAETIYGRTIKAYNKERTICDIVRNRNNMDASILNDALKRYVELKDKNIPLLLSYARELKVEKPLRNYLEILL